VSFWNEGYDRVIVTNGLSKAYGLPGTPPRVDRCTQPRQLTSYGRIGTTRPSRLGCSAIRLDSQSWIRQ
jgi:hypothetical protein